MNYIEQNVAFFEKEKEKEKELQERNKKFFKEQKELQKTLYHNIDHNSLGKVITIVGENGSGKTNITSLTCPYYRTLYLNFESQGSAEIPQGLGEKGLIKYVPYNSYENQTPSQFLKKIVKTLQMYKEKSSDTLSNKVLVIDSIGELVSRIIEKEMPDSKLDKYHWDAGAFCSKYVIPKILNPFYNDLTDLGITVIQLCGINPPNEKGEVTEENLQVQSNVMKEWVKKTSNALYMIYNMNKDGKHSLLKDNSGLNDRDLIKLFSSRKLIIDSCGESPEWLSCNKEYLEKGNIVPYGIANILNTFATKGCDFLEEEDEKSMIEKSMKEYIENTN